MKMDLIKANVVIADVCDSSWPSLPHHPALPSLDLAGHMLTGSIPAPEKFLIAEALKSLTLQVWQWTDTCPVEENQRHSRHAVLGNPDPAFPTVKPL